MARRSPTGRAAPGADPLPGRARLPGPAHVAGGSIPVLVSVESSGPACPARQQGITARVDAVAGWVGSVVDGLP